MEVLAVVLGPTHHPQRASELGPHTTPAKTHGDHRSMYPSVAVVQY